MDSRDDQSLCQTDDLPEVDEADLNEAASTLDPADRDSGVYFGIKPEKALAELTDRVTELGIGTMVRDAVSLLDRMLATLSGFGSRLNVSRRPWWARLVRARNRSAEARFRDTALELDRLAAQLESVTNPIISERMTLGRLEEQLKRGIGRLDAYIKAGLSELGELKDTPIFQDLLYRLEDMRMARAIACQNLAAIQVMRRNRKALADRIQFVLERALPLWHHQARFAVELLIRMQSGQSLDVAESQALSDSELSRAEASELLAEVETDGTPDPGRLIGAVNRRLSQVLDGHERPGRELQAGSHRAQT